MYFSNDDYLEFLNNLEYYLKEPLFEHKNSKGNDYPIGYINKKNKSGKILLNFMHYKSFEEAKTT